METSNYKLGLMVIAVAAVSFGSSFAMFNPETVEQNAQNEKTFINGHVDVVVRDGETGVIKAYSQSDNSILSGGMTLLAEQLFDANGTSSGTLSHIQVGTDGTAPTGTQEGVIAGILDCDRATTTDQSNNSTAATATVVVISTAQIDAGSDTDCAVSGIQEAAIYNAATGGEAFARNTFSPVTLAGTDTLDITWTFTFLDT